jgi:hypothetical protein
MSKIPDTTSMLKPPVKPSPQSNLHETILEFKKRIDEEKKKEREACEEMTKMDTESRRLHDEKKGEDIECTKMQQADTASKEFREKIHNEKRELASMMNEDNSSKKNEERIMSIKKRTLKPPIVVSVKSNVCPPDADYEAVVGITKRPLNEFEIQSYLDLIEFLDKESRRHLETYSSKCKKSLTDLEIFDKFEKDLTDFGFVQLIELAYSEYRSLLKKYTIKKRLFDNISDYVLQEKSEIQKNGCEIHAFNAIFAFMYFISNEKNKELLLMLLKNEQTYKSCNNKLQAFLMTKRGGKILKSRKYKHKKSNRRKTRRSRP